MRFIEPLEEGKTYHIYNRGNNSEDIFIEKRNYYYFLQKYSEYCTAVVETYAYALLKNHFHLLVNIKENVIINRHDGMSDIKLNASRQLSHFFNCYAQSINRAYGRHGKLLEQPFRRKAVVSDNNLTSLIYYIHINPQKHQFVKDFRNWEFTSWHSLLNNDETFLAKEKVIDWFGNKKQFIKAHKSNMPLNKIS